MTDRDGYFCSSMTPEKGITWEEDHVTEPPKGLSIDWWKFPTKGNPYLSPEGIAKFEASIKDDDSRRVKMEGDFLGGSAFSQKLESLPFSNSQGG